MLLRRVCFLILASLLFSTSLTLAQSAEPASDHFGVEGARKAGLVTELNLSQTIKGVTAFVQWAYMDAHVLHLRYYVDGNDTRINKQVAKATSSQLRDANGYLFQCCHFSSGSPDLSAPVNARVQELKYPVPADYLEGFDTLPNEISLIFELNTQGYVIPDASIPPERTPEAAPTTEPDIFRFEFTVPFYPAIQFEPNQTVEANGVPVTLQSLSITPASTKYTLCYDLPNEREWVMGNPQITVAGELPFSMMFLDMHPFQNGCTEWEQPVYYAGNGGKVTFTFDYLNERDFSAFPTTEEGWAEILPTLEEKQVKVELVDGKNLKGMRSMTDTGLEDAMVELGLWQRIEGPWEFSVDIPQ
jgi:hypothetical protein